MMEVHSIQEYISLLEKLEKLYTFRTSNNVSIGWIPNFTYKPHFIYRGQGDYRYTILPGILGQKMDRMEENPTRYLNIIFYKISSQRHVGMSRKFLKTILVRGLRLHSILEFRQDCWILQKIR